MTRSPLQRMMYVLSNVFGVAPFAFGLLRYVQTGYDLRMLWMAVASFVGAGLVWVTAKGRSDRARTTLTFSILTLVVTTLLATLTGFMLGATSGPGAWMVAFVFGLSWTATYVLGALSRPRAV